MSLREAIHGKSSEAVWTPLATLEESYGLRIRYVAQVASSRPASCKIHLSPSRIDNYMEVIGGLVAPLVFKTSVGLKKVPGGFDSHSPPVPSFV